MEKRVIRRLQTKFSAEDNTDKTSAIQVPVLHQMEPTTSFQHDAWTSAESDKATTSWIW